MKFLKFQKKLRKNDFSFAQISDVTLTNIAMSCTKNSVF